MSTIEIKDNIINKLTLIDDESFLEAINILINNKADEKIYKLSPEQIKSIERGRQDIKDGKYITNEDLMLKMSEWLEKE